MLRALLLPALLTVHAALVAAASPEPYGGTFWIRWIDDSIWAHCEMDVWANEDGSGQVSTECRWEDGPRHKKERKLTTGELADLRRLLRSADLFQGQVWGHDRRGLDLNLLTVQVSDGGRTVVAVASGNPSFESGPRKMLLDALAVILKSTDARPRAS